MILENGRDLHPWTIYILDSHDKVHVRQVSQGSSPPLSLYNLKIILKMVEIPTHKPNIFLIIIIRCID